MSRPLSRRRFVGSLAAAAFGGAVPLAASPWRRGALAAATPVSTTPPPSPSAEAVLRIDIVGGYVPVQVNLTRLPLIAIYADGTVITNGPVIDIYPAPALPNLRQLTLTPAGLAQVSALAQAAGLDGDHAYEGANVTDLPDTVFTFVHAGRTATVSAYALGFDEETIADPTLRAARAKLLGLQGQLIDLAGALPAAAIARPDGPYEIDRLRIYAQRINPANPPDADLPQTPVDWPLASGLATFGDTEPAMGDARCGVVEGADARTLVAALTKTNALTPWVSDGVSYLLWILPLLPDEPSTCR